MKILNNIYRLILRRKPFKGQFRLFLWLFNNKQFSEMNIVTKPLEGNFLININTKEYIEASIYFTGDYESYIKKIFKRYIKEGDIVLDIGANIGFHSLYFSQLVGVTGKVYAFEPMTFNFSSLIKNISINNFKNIVAVNKALGNDHSLLKIHLDETQTNKGAYNLFNLDAPNYEIEVIKGDSFLTSEHINSVNFIKIDVEGFELNVFQGLLDSISKFKPYIVFEYDKSYQINAGNSGDEIFILLKNLNYSFQKITQEGMVDYDASTNWGNILALPPRLK